MTQGVVGAPVAMGSSVCICRGFLTLRLYPEVAGPHSIWGSPVAMLSCQVPQYSVSTQPLASSSAQHTWPPPGLLP